MKSSAGTSLPGIVSGDLHINAKGDHFSEKTHYDRIRLKSTADSETHFPVKGTDADLHIGCRHKTAEPVDQGTIRFRDGDLSHVGNRAGDTLLHDSVDCCHHEIFDK